MPNWVTRLGRRVRALFRSEALDDELREEIRLHVELETEDLMRTQGLSRDEAHRRAMIGFGGVTRYREAQRDARGVRWLEQLGQDVKYAGRSLRKSPGFVGTAVLTIALGIGVTTAVYSVVDRLMLNPLPFAHADRWRMFGTVIPTDGQLRAMVLTDDEADWARRATSFDAMSVVADRRGILSGPEHSVYVDGADVAPTLLRSLGVQPVIGRLLGEPDAASTTSRTMVLSERFWHREFGGSPTVVGQRFVLDDTSYTVVGVVPDRLDAITNYRPMDFWAPMTRAEGTLLAQQRAFVPGIAELKPGVSDERAERELDLLHRQRRSAAEVKANNPLAPVLIRPNEVMNTHLKTSLWVLAAATVLMLFAVCANVAGLQLVRGEHRVQELSIRSALGASRSRLVCQLSVEGAVLAVIGGGAGLILGYWLLRAAVAFRPRNLDQLAVVQFDGRVVLFGIGLTALASVLYSALPAWSATRVQFGTMLRGVWGMNGRRTRSRQRSLVIVAELALSVILLAGAGLLTRSFGRMLSTDPGFVPSGLLELSVMLPRDEFPDSVARAAFWSALVERADGLPGVMAAVAAPTGMLQSQHMMGQGSLQIEGSTILTGPLLEYSFRTVPGRYFSLLGIRVLAGHAFTPADERHETNNVVIGAGLARLLFPNQNVVGHRLRAGPHAPWVTVEGVVSDVGVIGPSPANGDLQIYFPTQSNAIARASGIMLRLRAGTDVGGTLSALRGIVKSINPRVAILNAGSEQSILDENLAIPRFTTLLMDLFAVMALVLGAIGLYGLVAYTIGQRTREIGVRVALGATPNDISWAVLREGLGLALLGLVIGTAIALGVTRLLTSLLYGVSPTDPIVFGGVALGLVGVALGASLIPALRAARVDPVIALRAE